MEIIRNLAQKYPNITGVQMDDFFRGTLDSGQVGVPLALRQALRPPQSPRSGRRHVAHGANRGKNEPATT
jgi:hypothetical protein